MYISFLCTGYVTLHCLPLDKCLLLTPTRAEEIVFSQNGEVWFDSNNRLTSGGPFSSQLNCSNFFAFFDLEHQFRAVQIAWNIIPTFWKIGSFLFMSSSLITFNGGFLYFAEETSPGYIFKMTSLKNLDFLDLLGKCRLKCTGSRGVPRGDAQDARASPPPSPAWKAGYEKRWCSMQQREGDILTVGGPTNIYILFLIRNGVNLAPSLIMIPPWQKWRKKSKFLQCTLPISLNIDSV